MTHFWWSLDEIFPPKKIKKRRIHSYFLSIFTFEVTGMLFWSSLLQIILKVKILVQVLCPVSGLLTLRRTWGRAWQRGWQRAWPAKSVGRCPLLWEISLLPKLIRGEVNSNIISEILLSWPFSLTVNWVWCNCEIRTLKLQRHYDTSLKQSCPKPNQSEFCFIFVSNPQSAEAAVESSAN